MRDPKRIEKICEKLRILWTYYPDMRLGQLLENFIYPHHMNSNGCIFYYEDDMVEGKLDEMIEECQMKIYKRIQEDKRKNKKELWENEFYQ
jgi:hypothetical protein